MDIGGFFVERRHLNGFLRLKLGGELDLATADTLRRELLPSEDDVASDGTKGIIVDTTDLTFMDSAGLEVLMAGRRRLGDRFILIPGQTTKRILQVTGTAGFFGSVP